MDSNQKLDGPDAGREFGSIRRELPLKNDRGGTENSLGSAQFQEKMLETGKRWILNRNVSTALNPVSSVLPTPNLSVASVPPKTRCVVQIVNEIAVPHLAESVAVLDPR